MAPGQQEFTALPKLHKTNELLRTGPDMNGSDYHSTRHRVLEILELVRKTRCISCAEGFLTLIKMMRAGS